ncbi:MAG: hypothetical protein K9G62_03985 [Alphaproteobacteria bacterium]|nr:hypothetical protein [Alphaproteobacteria bacterium]
MSIDKPVDLVAIALEAMKGKEHSFSKISHIFRGIAFKELQQKETVEFQGLSHEARYFLSTWTHPDGLLLENDVYVKNMDYEEHSYFWQFSDLSRKKGVRVDHKSEHLDSKYPHHIVPFEISEGEISKLKEEYGL